MRYALESARQNVDQKTPEELIAFECHNPRLLSAFQSVIFPLKRDLTVFHIEQPLVGKSHPVSVAAEIIEYLARTSERRLRVNHPFGFSQRLQTAQELSGIVQSRQFPEETEFFFAECAFQPFQKEAAKEPGKNFDGKKETGPARHPAFSIRRESTAGNHAMQMRSTP